MKQRKPMFRGSEVIIPYFISFVRDLFFVIVSYFWPYALSLLASLGISQLLNASFGVDTYTSITVFKILHIIFQIFPVYVSSGFISERYEEEEGKRIQEVLDNGVHYFPLYYNDIGYGKSSPFFIWLIISILVCIYGENLFFVPVGEIWDAFA